MSTRPEMSEDDLHAYVDGALGGERRLEMKRALAADPDLARRAAALEAQRSALRDALAPVAAEPVPAALDLEHLLAARRSGTATRPQLGSWRRAFAALVLLCIGALAGWLARGAGEPPSSGLAALAYEASVMYAAYAPDRAHPVEFRADDKTQLLQWIEDRLHRPVVAPDLAASGFRFMGGRLVATPHGPAGLFMYDDDHGTRICIVLRPMPSETATAMAQDDRAATKSFTWSYRGMGYGLVGPAAAEDLHPLANEARRQMDRNV